MRKLQKTYNLEPAGSHGVWGLDDYHFIPFALGASELINHSEILTPDAIHNDKLVDKYCDDYIYMGCIKFIKSVRKCLILNVIRLKRQPTLESIHRC